MSAKERHRTRDYRRRLQVRLERQAEDAGYAELQQVARINTLLESRPYDHAARYLADTADTGALADYAVALAEPPESLLDYGWPDNKPHSVKA